MNVHVKIYLSKNKRINNNIIFISSHYYINGNEKEMEDAHRSELTAKGQEGSQI